MPTPAEIVQQRLAALEAEFAQFIADQGQGGRVTRDQIADFIRTHATEANLEVPGSTSTALYSSAFPDGTRGWQYAQDLAARSGQKIAIVDDTALGKFIADVVANPQEFTSDLLDDAFKNRSFWGVASENFVSYAEGPLITITPYSTTDSVYFLEEIGAVLNNSKITSINGMTREELFKIISHLSPESQRAVAKSIFDRTFAEAIEKAGDSALIKYAAANGAALDISAETLIKLGITDLGDLRPLLRGGGSTILQGTQVAEWLDASIAFNLKFEKMGVTAGPGANLIPKLQELEGAAGEGKTAVERLATMLRDLREAGIRLLEDESGFLNLAKIEQAFLRTFHGDSAKMATFSEYVEASARWVISWVELGLAEVPAFLKGGIDQLIASFHKADGSINKKRLTLTIAGGILAAATLWAEWHKHKDDPGGFTGWLAEEGKEIVEGFFSPVGIGLLILGETPLGPALFVTLGAVAVYTAIHLILHEVVDATKPDAGEEPSWLWLQLDALDKWLTTIENKVETWIERGIKDITDGVERLVSEILRDAFQFVGGEGAAIVSERNEIVVGDDVALIVGDER